MPLAVLRSGGRVPKEILLAQFACDAGRGRIEVLGAGRSSRCARRCRRSSRAAPPRSRDRLSRCRATASIGPPEAEATTEWRPCGQGTARHRRRVHLLRRARRSVRCRWSGSRCVDADRVDQYFTLLDQARQLGYAYRLLVSLPSEITTSAFLRLVPRCARGMAAATASALPCHLSAAPRQVVAPRRGDRSSRAGPAQGVR